MRKITKSHTLHRLYTIRIEFIMQLGSLYYYKFGTYIHVSHLAVIIKYDINKLIILQCFLEILSYSPKNKPLLLRPSSCTGIFTALLSPPYATKIAVSAKNRTLFSYPVCQVFQEAISVHIIHGEKLASKAIC